MGTLINGIKEIFASASQTSPTNIPTCAADGTPNGNITIDNLASVLGVGITPLSENTDLNDVTELGFYYCNSTIAVTIGHQPCYIGFSMQVTIGYGSSALTQTIVDYNGILYIRTKQDGGTWSNWRTYSYDYPTFYKDYGSLSALANALGVHSEKYVNVGNLSSVQVDASSCSLICWCVRGASYQVGIAALENTSTVYVKEGFGTVSYGNNKATITFPTTLGDGCVLRYVIIAFSE